MDKLLEAILLGVVQGVTEWLPISSSGHLALLQQYFKMENPVFFDVMLHVGTLIVILLFFREDISRILKVVFVKREFKTEEAKMVELIIVGNIPLAILGFTFGESIEKLFESPIAIATALIFTGTIIYLTKFSSIKKNTISFFDSILIGIAQAFALIPGISRSGATIATALLLGIKHEKAMKYSFLLSIPAVLAAAIGKTLSLNYQGINIYSILIGMMVSIVVGLFSLKFLKITLNKKLLYAFAPYCWILGISLFCLNL